MKARGHRNAFFWKTCGSILADAVRGRKRDYLAGYKFNAVQEYYGRRCLDVGAGNGQFAEWLTGIGREVVAVDIVAKTHGFPVALFDGKTIPFADASYDTALLMFVLHHADGQESLLNECRRIARQTIIVAEDVVETAYDRCLAAIHVGTSPWSRSDVGCRSDVGWREAFARWQLPVLQVVQVPRSAYPIYPVRRMIYVLAAGPLPRGDSAQRS